MTKHRLAYGCVLVTIALVVLLGYASLGRAGFDSTEQWSRSAVAGLKGVGVYVAVLIDDYSDADTLKRQLQTDVELRLRRAGVPVLTRIEAETTKRRPMLNIKIMGTTVDVDPKFVFATITADMTQRATVVDTNIEAPATTWGRVATRGASERLIKGVIREQVSDCVDEFANAYLAANPPPQH